MISSPLPLAGEGQGVGANKGKTMLQQLRPAILSVLVLAFLTGFLFPGVITLIATPSALSSG